MLRSQEMASVDERFDTMLPAFRAALEAKSGEQMRELLRSLSHRFVQTLPSQDLQADSSQRDNPDQNLGTDAEWNDFFSGTENSVVVYPLGTGKLMIVRSPDGSIGLNTQIGTASSPNIAKIWEASFPGALDSGYCVKF